MTWLTLLLFSYGCYDVTGPKIIDILYTQISVIWSIKIKFNIKTDQSDERSVILNPDMYIHF